MSSPKCMGCLKYSTLGKLLAGIQIAIGVALVVLGPLVYDVNICEDYYFHGYYSWFCYEVYFATWTVVACGGLFALGGTLLLLGLFRGGICYIRTYILLTVAAVIALVVTAILLIVDYGETGIAIVLISVSVYTIISLGFTAKYGRIMIRLLTPQGLALAVVTPAQQGSGPQPVTQNTFVSHVSYPQSSSNFSQPPPQPYNFNQQPLYSFNSAYGNQGPNFPQPYYGSHPNQQYNPPLQTYPNAPGYNAFANPAFNPAMSPQLSTSSPVYSAPRPTPTPFSRNPSAPHDVGSSPPSAPNSCPPYNPGFQ